MARAAQPPSTPAETRYTVQVELTMREMAALAGTGGQLPVAVCVTSTDDDRHRVNYAEAGLKRFVAAVQQRRP